MTKEEYKENLIRMFDSIRSDYKGLKTCEGVSCSNCPFNRKVCNLGELVFNSCEAIEIVENWAKEHPVKTNSGKFEEVFGFEPTPIYCVNNNVKCEDCEYFDYNDGLCDASRFWDAEYMPPKEGKE